MSRATLDRFYEEVMEDEGLQGRLHGASDADEFIRSVTRLGRERGHDISEDEVRDALAENQEKLNSPEAELSDAELESVSGGVSPLLFRNAALPLQKTIGVFSGSNSCGCTASCNCLGGGINARGFF